MTEKRKLLLKALVSIAKAERDDALAMLEIFLDGTNSKSTVDDLDHIVGQLADAENKLKVLSEHFKVSIE